jgi:cell division protein FtsN
VPAETPPPPPPETPEDRASILDRLFGKGAAESAGIASPKPAEAPPVKGDARGADAKAAPEPKAAEIRASEGKPAEKIADVRPPDAAKDGTSYLLQAGAFRSQDDADGMKAKLALLGIEARVLTAEVNGQTMYRVRVGPFAQIDDMNKARARLAENGIEASVLRQR